jgi:hypothetical protein
LIISNLDPINFRIDVNKILQKWFNANLISLNWEKLSNNINVNSGTDESPVSSNQPHSMFATFMAAMRAENAKLASTLESKLNTIKF